MIRKIILIILASPLILLLVIALIFMGLIGWLAEPLCEEFHEQGGVR